MREVVHDGRLHTRPVNDRRGLIGFAAIALLYFNGRIAGISGIMGGVLRPQKGDTLWRAVFLAGLMTGAALILMLHPAAMDLRFDVSDSTIIPASPTSTMAEQRRANPFLHFDDADAFCAFRAEHNRHRHPPYQPVPRGWSAW